MKKVIIVLSFITIIVAAVFSAIVFFDVLKPDDEVTRGPTPTKHVITKQMEEYGFSVSEEVEEKASDLNTDNVQSIKETLYGLGLRGKKLENLSEAIALMGMSYGQIENKKAKEIDGELIGVKTTVISINIKKKTHKLYILFDIDKNRTIQDICDENGERLYGFDENNVLFAKNVNNFYK